MSTFQIDLLHPERFAKTWFDWSGTLQAFKKHLFAYFSEALTILEIVGINLPRLYDCYRERKGRHAQRIYAGRRTRLVGTRTTFHIDILHVGEFAKTWEDWFVGPQGLRRLVVSYIIAAIVVATMIVIAIPNKRSLYEEGRTIQELRQKIAKRQKDLKDQQTQFRGIVELGRYEVAWAGVLRALSESMPTDLWLQSIEFIDVPSIPKPRAVAAKKPPAPVEQLFRIVLVAPLLPGSGNLIDVNKFLRDLGQDSSFKKRFRLKDWQVVASKRAGKKGKKREQHLITTVTYRVIS